MAVAVRTRTGIPLTTIEEWELHASTKGKWAEGYSAKELARLWLGPCGPRATVDALEPVFEGLVLDRAVAEARVSFDSYEGGVRNHDVLAFGRMNSGPVVIGVEGKVNESLDATIDQKYAAARRLQRQQKTTNLDKRLDSLLAGIAASSISQNPGLGMLRYQLFTAIAGTVAAAETDTVAAAVVVHLIRTAHAKPEKFDATRAAVADFASALGLDPTSPVIGPVPVRAAHLRGPRGLPCWIAVTETSAAGG